MLQKGTDSMPKGTSPTQKNMNSIQRNINPNAEKHEPTAGGVYLGVQLISAHLAVEVDVTHFAI